MLPDQAADVPAVGAGLTAKAGREGSVGDGKLCAVQDLVGVQVGDGYLRRGDQVQRARVVRIAALGLEQVRLELGQLARAAQGFGPHQERRVHLGVAVLLGVQIEHEGRQRAHHAGALAPQHREARAAELRRAIEVENAELGAQVPVRLGIEVEARCGAPGAARRVVFFALAVGGCGVGQVRNAEQLVLDGSLRFRELGFELLDLIRELLQLRPPRFEGGLVAALRQLAHGLALGVALRLQRFRLADQLSPTCKGCTGVVEEGCGFR